MRLLSVQSVHSSIDTTEPVYGSIYNNTYIFISLRKQIWNNGIPESSEMNESWVSFKERNVLLYTGEYSSNE